MGNVGKKPSCTAPNKTSGPCSCCSCCLSCFPCCGKCCCCRDENYDTLESKPGVRYGSTDVVTSGPCSCCSCCLSCSPCCGKKCCCCDGNYDTLESKSGVRYGSTDVVTDQPGKEKKEKKKKQEKTDKSDKAKGASKHEKPGTKIEQKPEKKNLNLLLVGKTGSGISSTCKSIAPESQAKELGGFSPVTEVTETGCVELLDGIGMNVVAIPGVRDPEGDDRREGQSRHFRTVICEAFRHVESKEFDAIVLVLSYLERIHAEFRDTIGYLEVVLGKNGLQKHGVLLLTGADNLERDLGDSMKVEDWVAKQKGFFKELYDKCGQRFVLFDNVTDEVQGKVKQRQNLARIVDMMANSSDPNTNAKYPTDSVYTFGNFKSENPKFMKKGEYSEIKKRVDALSKKIVKNDSNEKNAPKEKLNNIIDERHREIVEILSYMKIKFVIECPEKYEEAERLLGELKDEISGQHPNVDKVKEAAKELSELFDSDKNTKHEKKKKQETPDKAKGASSKHEKAGTKIEQKPEKKKLNLLLVGKTGSGISSTCKSIAPESQAKELGGFSPVTEVTETGCVELLDGIGMNVVAIPGVRDPEGDDRREGQSRHFRTVICEAFRHVESKEFDAIVLVLSYLERIHAEFRDTIGYLEVVLGKNGLQKHGVLLLTGADNLERDLGDSMKVEDWVAKQKGFFKELYDKCGQRFVLFDNVTDEVQGKVKQRQNLARIVDKMANSSDPNTNAKYPTDSVYTFGNFKSENPKFMRKGEYSAIKKRVDALSKKIVKNVSNEKNAPKEKLNNKIDECQREIVEILSYMKIKFVIECPEKYEKAERLLGELKKEISGQHPDVDKVKEAAKELSELFDADKNTKKN